MKHLLLSIRSNVWASASCSPSKQCRHVNLSWTKDLWGGSKGMSILFSEAKAQLLKYLAAWHYPTFRLQLWTKGHYTRKNSCKIGQSPLHFGESIDGWNGGTLCRGPDKRFEPHLTRAGSNTPLLKWLILQYPTPLRRQRPDLYFCTRTFQSRNRL